jgi:hypothetical protein
VRGEEQRVSGTNSIVSPPSIDEIRFRDDGSAIVTAQGAVHAAVVRLQYGSLVRNRRTDRQIPWSLAAENRSPATTRPALR